MTGFQHVEKYRGWDIKVWPEDDGTWTWMALNSLTCPDPREAPCSPAFWKSLDEAIAAARETVDELINCERGDLEDAAWPT